MNNPRYALITSAVVSAVVLFLAGETAQSEAGGKANKLEGAWIAKAVGSPVQASYVFSPDASGRSAAISGLLLVGIPVTASPGSPVPKADYPSVNMTGEAVMTGADTASYSVVGYGVSKGIPPSPFDRVVFIWVDSGEIKFLAPGQTQVSHHVAYYLANADGDGDGLPDADASPVLCVPTTTLDTRIGVREPCTP